MTGRAARVEAQAKLNLFLRVLGRAPSGFHQLETLFQRISLSDSIGVRIATGRSLETAGADCGPTDKNLAWRAAVAFSEVALWPRGFAIEIEKRIPVGGGLGGGSADAGAVLRALNALAPTPLDTTALSAIAARLGSDVPFLASEFVTAIGLGRGEQLVPFAALPARDLILVLPGFPVSSGDAFGWYAAVHGSVPASTEAPQPLASQLDWNLVELLAANDLESVVTAHHPEIGSAVNTLTRAGVKIARMTGSGSTVFGVLDRPRQLVLPWNGVPPTLISARTVERVASVEVIA